jgi:hypothetical protein
VTTFVGAALTAGLGFGDVRGGAASGAGSAGTTGEGSVGGAGSSARAGCAPTAPVSASRDTRVASRVRARREGVIEAASIVVLAP